MRKSIESDLLEQSM